MPTAMQRITAVAATAIIILGGGWLASLASQAVANNVDAGETDQDILAAPRTAPSQSPIDPVPLSQKARDETAAPRALMQVSVDNIRNSRGKIYVALFDDAAAFDSHDYSSAAGLQTLSAKSGSISVSFPGLTAKPYAISIFHDENSNEIFDMSAGYPAEGYGMSRAESAYDDLKFHQASVQPGSVAIKLHYLQ